MYFVIQSDAVSNECLHGFLSAPSSLHLPYESNSRWRRKRKKNTATILNKLPQSKMSR